MGKGMGFLVFFIFFFFNTLNHRRPDLNKHGGRMRKRRRKGRTAIKAILRNGITSWTADRLGGMIGWNGGPMYENC